MTSYEKHRAIAQEYFKNNPTEEVVHITADGQVFFNSNHNDAVNHQRRIAPGEKLVTVRRHEKSLTPEPSPEENNGDAGDKGTPDETWKKDEIAEWLAVAGVELSGKEKKDELLAKVAEVIAEESGEEGEGDQEDESDESDNNDNN